MEPYTHHHHSVHISRSPPAKLTRFMVGAFSKCKNIKQINFPSSLAETGGVAFSGCVGLETVGWENKETEGEGGFKLKYAIFLNYIKLSKITLPTNLDSIGDKCFNGCTSLSKISIPSTTKYSGDLIEYISGVGICRMPYFGSRCTTPKYNPFGTGLLGEEVNTIISQANPFSSIYGRTVPTMEWISKNDRRKAQGSYTDWLPRSAINYDTLTACTPVFVDVGSLDLQVNQRFVDTIKRATRAVGKAWGATPRAQKESAR